MALYYSIGMLQECATDGTPTQGGHSWWIVLSGPHPNYDAAAIGMGRAVLARGSAERRSSYKLVAFEITDGYDLPEYGLPINNLHIVQSSMDAEEAE